MSTPLSSPPEDEPLADTSKPQRRRRSSRSKSRSSKSPLQRRKKPLPRRLKNIWRRYRRFLPYVFLVIGLPAALGFGLYTLHRISQQSTPPPESQERAERVQAWSNRSQRGFSLTNLAKMDIAGERSSLGRSLQVGPEVLPGKEVLAEAAFKGKNFAEAERLYAELLPIARRREVVQYHRFISLVFLNRRADAERIFPKQGRPSPAWFYSWAVVSFVDGDKETAHQLLEEARLHHPTLCAEYDPALRTLGFIE